MSEQKWVFHFAMVITAIFLIRGAFKTVFGDASRIAVPHVASLEEKISQPLHWTGTTRPVQSSENTKNSMIGSSPSHMGAMGVPAAGAPGMMAGITGATAAKVPTVPAKPGAAAPAKPTDPAAAAAAAAANKPGTQAASQTSFFNPQQSSDPNAANGNPTGAAGGMAGGSIVTGAAPQQDGSTASYRTYSNAGNTGTSGSLTASQVMSQLFPNGFTQTGMTQLQADVQSGKVSQSVYYQVVGQAAANPSSSVQAMAVSALVAEPGAQAFTLLATMAENQSSAVSSQVTAAIAQYQSTQMISYLATPMQSTNSGIRLQALETLNAAASSVLSQMPTSTGTTRSTASVSTYFSSYITEIQSIEKTETNAQNQQEEAQTLALVESVVQQSGGQVQAVSQYRGNYDRETYERQNYERENYNRHQ